MRCGEPFRACGLMWAFGALVVYVLVVLLLAAL